MAVPVKNEEASGDAGKKKSRLPRRQVAAAAAKAEFSSSGVISAASLKDRSAQLAEVDMNPLEQQALRSPCAKDESVEGLALALLKTTERSGVKSRPVLTEVGSFSCACHPAHASEFSQAKSGHWVLGIPG